MNRIYKTLPWGIIVLGALHMAATFKIYDAMTPAALWFFNGGIVLVVAGVLNFVNYRYGAEARGLRWFCRALNLVLLAFSVVSGIVDGASVASLIVVLGLLGGITVLSFLPSVANSSREPQAG